MKLPNQRRRGRNPHQVRAEINVTSLVDVAFTLLVIFIITAPVLQGGIEVNLPRGDVGYIEASDRGAHRDHRCEQRHLRRHHPPASAR